MRLPVAPCAARSAIRRSASLADPLAAADHPAIEELWRSGVNLKLVGMIDSNSSISRQDGAAKRACG